MIALIEIPSQRPARINWYVDRQSLLDDAVNYAAESDRDEPDNYDDALHCLSDDWYSHITVESVDDIERVRTYTGHQNHRIRAMVEKLDQEFGVDK